MFCATEIPAPGPAAGMRFWSKGPMSVLYTPGRSPDAAARRSILAEDWPGRWLSHGVMRRIRSTGQHLLPRCLLLAEEAGPIFLSNVPARWILGLILPLPLILLRLTDGLEASLSEQVVAFEVRITCRVL